MPKPRTSTKTNLKHLLSQLVALPTVTSDQAVSHAAIEWVRSQVAGLPLHLHQSSEGGFSSLVLTTQKTQTPKVLLMAHIDVVPAPVSHFKLTEKAGRWYGRGVFDMKLAIAIYIKLLHELGPELSKYDLGVMITSDEEASGHYGVERLVDEGWLPQVAINLDAASHWELERAAKGVLHIRVDSVGSSGHASRPWAYKNAINGLMDFLTEVRDQFPAEPCDDLQHRHNTLTVGTIGGGLARNQVPSRAEATLDIRTLPEVKLKDIEWVIQQIARRHPGITVTADTRNMALMIDPDNEYLQLAELLIRKTTGVKPKFVLSHGASDSRFLAARGIPTVMTRPPGGGAHGDDEWVEAKGAEQLHKIVREFVEQVGRR